MSESWRKELKNLISIKEKLLNNNNSLKAAKYCEKIGFLLFENGFADDAVIQFNEQAQIYINEKNVIETAKTYHILSDLYSDGGETDKALEYAQRYFNLSHQEGNLTELQRATATLGRIYYLKASTVIFHTNDDKKNKTKFLEKSLELYNQSISIIETLTSSTSKFEIKEMRARIYLNLAILLEEWGRIKEAEDKYKLAASISQDCQLSENEFKSLKNLADLKYFQCDFEECEKYAQESKRCASKLKDKSFITELDLLLSKIKIINGEFEQACQLLKNSYENIHLLIDSSIQEFNYSVKSAISCLNASKQLISIKSERMRSLLLHKIGCTLVKFRSYKLAIGYFTKELAILYTSKSSNAELFTTFRLLAKCYFKISAYNEALTYFEKALEKCEDRDENALDILLKIAQCQQHLDFDICEIKKTYIRAVKLLVQNPSARFESILYHQFNKFRRRFSLIENLSDYGLVLSKTYSSQESSTSASSQPCNSSVGSDFDVTEELNKIHDNRRSVESSGALETSSKKPSRKRFDPNKKNELGETPLHVAAIKGNSERVRELIELGADVNLRDNCGWIPLHEACNHGYLEIVQLLVDHGSYINDQGGINCDGITPLLDAAENKHFDVVMLLLERGADPSIIDKNGRSLFDVLRNQQNDGDFDNDDKEMVKRIMKIIQENMIRSQKPIAKSSISNSSKSSRPSTSSRLVALSSERVPLLIAAAKQVNIQNTDEISQLPDHPALTSSEIRNDQDWLIPDNNVDYSHLDINYNNLRRRKRVMSIGSDEDDAPSIASRNFSTKTHTVEEDIPQSDIFYDTNPTTRDLYSNNQNSNNLVPKNIEFSTNKSFLQFKVKIVNDDKIVVCKVEQASPLLGIHLYKSLANLLQTFENSSFDFILTDSNRNLIFPFVNINHFYFDNICVNCYTIRSKMVLPEIYRFICESINITPSNRIIQYLDSNPNTDNISLSYIGLGRLEKDLISFYYSLLLVKNIDTLDFSYCRIYDLDHLKFISDLLPYFHVKKLILKNFGLDLTRLNSLFSSISNSQSISNSESEPIGLLYTSLEYLDISHNSLNGNPCEFSHVFFNIFKYAKKISYFNISYCAISDDIFHPDLPFSGLFHGNPNLSEIDISSNEFDNSSLKHFFLNFLPWNNYKQIKVSNILKGTSQLPLHISSFMNMSDKSILELDISQNNCFSTFASISSLPVFYENITHLDLSYTDIGYQDLLTLTQKPAQMSSLQTLIISGCSAIFSDVDSLLAAISSFSYFPELRKLDLCECLRQEELPSQYPLSPSVIRNTATPSFNPLSKILVVNLHYNKIKSFQLEKWKLDCRLPETYDTQCNDSFCLVVRVLKYSLV